MLHEVLFEMGARAGARERFTVTAMHPSPTGRCWKEAPPWRAARAGLRGSTFETSGPSYP